MFLDASQGAAPVIPLSADLDEKSPAFRTSDGQPFRSSMNIDLAPGERVTLAVKVAVKNSMVTWQAALDVVDQDEPIHIGRRQASRSL